VVGFEAREENGEYETWVRWELTTIRFPDGQVITDTQTLDIHDIDPEEIWLYALWSEVGEVTRNDQKGEYEVEVVVKDVLTGESATASTI
jgi:hypothetical protein